MGLRVVRPGGYILIAMKDGYNSQSTRLVQWSSNISCSTTMAGSTCCASHSATPGQLGLPTTRRPPGGGTCEQQQQQLQLQPPQRLDVVSRIERIGTSEYFCKRILLFGNQPSFSLNVFLTQNKLILI